MLNITTPGIAPSANLSPRYALAMRDWLKAHPSWSEQKAMDVAVSLFLIMHSQDIHTFNYAQSRVSARDSDSN